MGPERPPLRRSGHGSHGRAVTLALAEAGAAGVVVVGRNADAATAAAALAGDRGRVGAVDEVDATDLVVNATSVGMGPDLAGRPRAADLPPPLPLDLDPARIGTGQLVVDLIYTPAVTPLLTAAAARGARTANGFGMLLHQAGRQLAAWTGQTPPLEVMAAAGRAELGRREQPPRQQPPAGDA